MSDDFEILHYYVLMRGGPLDGKTLGFSPTEFGHELRVASAVQVDADRLVLREVFYDLAGYSMDDDTRPWIKLYHADYAATQDTDLPRIK